MKRKEHKEADLPDLCSQSAFHEPVSWKTSFNLIDEKWIPAWTTINFKLSVDTANHNLIITKLA